MNQFELSGFTVLLFIFCAFFEGELVCCPTVRQESQERYSPSRFQGETYQCQVLYLVSLFILHRFSNIEP